MNKLPENQLVSLLRGRIPDLQAIYLFGSASQNRLRRDSDVDIAVLATNTLEPTLLFDIAGELATLVKRNVDLVDIDSASTVFCARIINEGKRLYCADETVCENYADMAFSRYAHLNEERRFILDDIKQRGSVYGG